MRANRFLRDFGRTFDRFGNLALASLPRQLLRAAALHLPARRSSPAAISRPERIVVTLSTTPARARLIGPALRSLLDQDEPADRVILALPRFSRRNSAPYPEPESLPLPSGVDVLRCEDHGPATKFLPALEAEPNALLVVADDDVIYPRSLLRELLGAHRRRPEAALALRGVRREPGTRFADLRHVFGTGVRNDMPVDIVFGTWGFLLPPGVAEAIPRSIEGSIEALRWVDDIWLSAQLAHAGVPRFVVPVSGLPLETLAVLRGSLSGGPNRSGSNEEAALAALGHCWDGEAAARKDGG